MAYSDWEDLDSGGRSAGLLQHARITDEINKGKQKSSDNPMLMAYFKMPTGKIEAWPIITKTQMIKLHDFFTKADLVIVVNFSKIVDEVKSKLKEINK